MLNLKKLLIVIVISLAALILGMLLPRIINGSSETRTLDSLFTAWSYGFAGLIIGFISSIILIIKVSAGKINRVLIFAVSLLVVEIVYVVLGNMNNWWR